MKDVILLENDIIWQNGEDGKKDRNYESQPILNKSVIFVNDILIIRPLYTVKSYHHKMVSI